MNRGEKLLELIGSEGWSIAKDILTEKMMDIQSVMNIEGKTGDEVIADIKLRQNLILEMRNWITEIEGTARQHEANETEPAKPQDDDHIERV